MSESEPPLYQPLEHEDSIRLLCLRRTPPPRRRFLRATKALDVLEVECFFVTSRLSDRPSYQALSYTWGPDNPKHPIILNGRKHLVRSNLWNFLQMASSSNTMDVNLLWVDALCISQESIEEKNRQVRQIGEIFGSALRVIVWLGVQQPIHRSWISKLIAASIGRQKEDKQRIYRAKTNGYWRRTWIIQELILAGHVIFYYGSHMLSEKVLLETEVDARSQLKENDAQRKTRHSCAVILMCRMAYMSLDEQQLIAMLRPNIPDLMDFFLSGECELRLDKVYAIRSLVRPKTSLEVDYNIDEVTLYWRVLASTQQGINVHKAEMLRISLGITSEDLLLKSKALIAASDSSVTSLTIDAHFHQEENQVDESWDMSQLPAFRSPDESSSYVLHGGVVQKGYTLLSFGPTDIIFVLNLEGEQGNVVKGIAKKRSDGDETHPETCNDKCLCKQFSEIVATSGEAQPHGDGGVYLPISPSNWLWLCKLAWEWGYIAERHDEM